MAAVVWVVDGVRVTQESNAWSCMRRAPRLQMAWEVLPVFVFDSRAQIKGSRPARPAPVEDSSYQAPAPAHGASTAPAPDAAKRLRR